MPFASVSFECWADGTALGEQVAIVGSCGALGNWNPAKCLRLDTRPPCGTPDAASGAIDRIRKKPFPVWSTCAELPLGDLEYKYVVVKGEGEVSWEGDLGGPNRKISVNSADKFVVRDKYWYPAPSWTTPGAFQVEGSGATKLPSPTLSNIYCCSFNIRYDTPESQEHDKEDRWDLRKDAIIKFLHRRSFDIIGFQEPCVHQVQWLFEQLWKDGYSYVGTGRESDGSGEAAAIFYKDDKLELRRWKTSWLSGKPNEAGSLLPGASHCPRTLTCLELHGNIQGRTYRISCFNTHLDFVGLKEKNFKVQTAMAELALRLMDDFCPTDLVPSLRVLTGDFNSVRTAERSPYAVITKAGYQDAGQDDTLPTFQGFDLKGGTCQANNEIGTIDFIFAKGQALKVMDFEAVQENYVREGEKRTRQFSDHLPIAARIGFPVTVSPYPVR
mmetsp:Transcript_30197/g.54820  ORF Transcript_30197/g.54820 Transcript_30197/m.54820 type:complete len:442 (-) Transcript_30197:42-1367(-)|eukprot:CAMPEP_0197630434 /NCGR_PEP_ID=MMETSP1338-20131121/7918_1 /TAXON_ID=43686 ORGANISM="Pelagodinium beii, Strain RCC1491" /NCGR_SAMPLE_ID=MMETSP1338 /ASSEMBLY_ACC=CAM_ASM_000754 /LENGTH=441 /DNA_ID=CAMNT_0043201647 /DNA_START=64 /DNA_END=1389 /DNA_ORIENTATION=-